MGTFTSKVLLKARLLFRRYVSEKSLWNRVSAQPVIDAPTQLIYIHIGKCGGSSLWDAIQTSELLKGQFSRIAKIHVEKPPLFSSSKYLFVVRDPVERAMSAFNWRYKLVVEDGIQRSRFEGEWEALTKHKTLNNLAESLYTEDKLSSVAAADFNTIHHLKETISFYLQDLLQCIEAHQIFAVMETETLDDDIANILDVEPGLRRNVNSGRMSAPELTLTPLATANLRRFLARDYECLQQLREMSAMSGRGSGDAESLSNG